MPNRIGHWRRRVRLQAFKQVLHGVRGWLTGIRNQKLLHPRATTSSWINLRRLRSELRNVKFCKIVYLILTVCMMQSESEKETTPMHKTVRKSPTEIERNSKYMHWKTTASVFGDDKNRLNPTEKERKINLKRSLHNSRKISAEISTPDEEGNPREKAATGVAIPVTFLG